MSLQLLGVAVMSAIAGMGAGLWWGKRVWMPKQAVTRSIRNPVNGVQ